MTFPRRKLPEALAWLSPRPLPPGAGRSARAAERRDRLPRESDSRPSTGSTGRESR